MRSVVDLYERLRDKYDGSLIFEKISEHYHIIVYRTHLGEGASGISRHAGRWWIVLADDEHTTAERREVTWHELYNVLAGGCESLDRVISKREESNNDLFAVLCMIPHVRPDDTPEVLANRYGFSVPSAMIRIKYETKKSAA